MGKKITTTTGHEAKTTGQLLGMGEAAAADVSNLYIDYSNAGAQATPEMLEKFHQLTGEKANIKDFLKYGAKIGGQN